MGRRSHREKRRVTGGRPRRGRLLFGDWPDALQGPQGPGPPKGGASDGTGGDAAGAGEARTPRFAGLSILRAGIPLGRRERRTGKINQGEAPVGRIAPRGIRRLMEGDTEGECPELAPPQTLSTD